jgi:hypothetical protein
MDARSKSRQTSFEHDNLLRRRPITELSLWLTVRDAEGWDGSVAVN